MSTLMLSAKETASSEYQRQFGECPPTTTVEKPCLNDDGTILFNNCVVSGRDVSNRGAYILRY
jgi:hypothetical protein